LVSKPENAAAIYELLESEKLPVVGTFQAIKFEIINF